MRIYDHWARDDSQATAPDGQRYWLVAWGGSNSDLSDAESEASKSIQAMQQTLNKNGYLKDAYEYEHDRPLKESVIERFGDIETPYAAITRNRYGALVLNSVRVFVADVDRAKTVYVPEESRSEHKPRTSSLSSPVAKNQGILSRLFGWVKKGVDDSRARNREKLIEQAEAERLEQEALAFARFDAFHSKFPSVSFRVYETAAGYRIVVTNQTIETDSAESSLWLDELGSDKLYTRLCKKQQCYRARLTPKPWRLPDCTTEVFYPSEQYVNENGLEAWLKRYDEQSREFAVCRLVKSYGDELVIDEVAKVLSVHDKHVLGYSTQPLA